MFILYGTPDYRLVVIKDTTTDYFIRSARLGCFAFTLEEILAFSPDENLELRPQPIFLRASQEKTYPEIIQIPDLSYLAQLDKLIPEYLI